MRPYRSMSTPKCLLYKMCELIQIQYSSEYLHFPQTLIKYIIEKNYVNLQCRHVINDVTLTDASKSDLWINI